MRIAHSLVHVVSVIYLLFVYCSEVTPVSAQVPNHPSEQAVYTEAELREFVSRLTSTDFDIREQASARLAEAGESAMFILEGSVGSTDLEVQARVHSLLVRIRGKILKERLDGFLRDSDSTNSHGLRAWDAFSAKMGRSRLSKQMFSEIYISQPQLADLCANGGEAMLVEANRIVERIRKLRYLHEPDLGDGLSLIFAAIRSDKPMPANVEITTLFLARSVPLSNYLKESRVKVPVNKLIGAWLNQMSDSAIDAGFLIALDCDASACIERARVVLSNPIMNPIAVQDSMLAVARYGTTNDVPLLNRWMNDETVLEIDDREVYTPSNMAPNDADRLEKNEPEPKSPAPQPKAIPRQVPASSSMKRRFELRVQDVALASAVKLSGEKFTEFFPAGVRLHPSRVFDLHSLMFPLDDIQPRKAALELWRKKSGIDP